jgi:hypothetical protein
MIRNSLTETGCLVLSAKKDTHPCMHIWIIKFKKKRHSLTVSWPHLYFMPISQHTHTHILVNRNYVSPVFNSFLVGISVPTFVFLLLLPQSKESRFWVHTQETPGNLPNIHLANNPANSSTLRINKSLYFFWKAWLQLKPNTLFISTVRLLRNTFKFTHHDKVPAMKIRFSIVRSKDFRGKEELLLNSQNVILQRSGQNIRFLEVLKWTALLK